MSYSFGQGLDQVLCVLDSSQFLFLILKCDPDLIFHHDIIIRIANLFAILCINNLTL